MQMAISLRGAITDSSSFRFSWSSTSASSSSSSSSLHFTHNFIPSSSIVTLTLNTSKLATSSRNKIICSAVQESSASTTATAETKDENATPKVDAAPAKAKKAAAKSPAKALPQMMEEDVIPPLKAILEAQEDLSDIELVFQDNKLEGSFSKQGIPYTFWAFFPDGGLTGPKGFSLSSYNSEASTVEPFLIDEKKITAKHIIFWVEKRLAAQGIIPVWKD